jgi:hypothetical protein
MRTLLLMLVLCSLLPGVESELQLRGSGRLSWLWYDIYDVELRLPAGAAVDPALQPCQLTFRYLRAFSVADLAKATTKTVRERLGAYDREEVERGLAAINALWPAVIKGDTLVLTATPGGGTSVALNGRELGVVPGDVFARVLFSIWLGDDPVDGELKRQLLPKA